MSEAAGTIDANAGNHERASSLLAKLDTRYLIAARACFLSMALLCASMFGMIWGQPGDPRLKFSYNFIAIGFLFTGISAIWLKTRGATTLFVHSQYVADVMLITAVIYVTGGPISPFLFLYLILGMAAALMMNRNYALLLSALSMLAYGALIACLRMGLFRSADGSALILSPAEGVALQMIGLASGMVLVCVLTGFLSGVARVNLALVEQQRRDLSILSQKQKTLIDSLPDGVITTNLEESVTSVNAAARELLRLGDREISGLKVNQALHALDSQFPPDIPAASAIHPRREIELDAGSGEPLRLVYHVRELRTDGGEKSGLIFVFQDVTKLRSIEDQLALQERMARLLAEKDDRTLVTATKLREFVGESPVMQKVFNLIGRVAPSEATVLVTGESGTGKELVAKAIHLGSPRASGKFQAVNCGAIPENLIESELFGHRKGSFTGADSDYTGLFRQADGGTVFLDEIGELPLHMQTKLLRTIQERTVRPLGSDRDIPVSVRIIAATNRNLRREVELGNFREDLYYRLNVISVSLPSLRTRKEDIPLLVNSILKGLIEEGKAPVVSPQAMNLLLQYDYPGNVRELENILERAVVLGSEVVLPEHLPEAVTNYKEEAGVPRGSRETRVIVDEEIELPVELDALLADIERRYLEIALIKTQGAKKKAAELLGINFRSFRYRLQKFGIADD